MRVEQSSIKSSSDPEALADFQVTLSEKPEQAASVVMVRASALKSAEDPAALSALSAAENANREAAASEITLRTSVMKNYEGARALADYYNMAEADPAFANTEMKMRVACASTENGSKALNTYYSEAVHHEEVAGGEITIRSKALGNSEGREQVALEYRFTSENPELASGSAHMRARTMELQDRREALATLMKKVSEDDELSALHMKSDLAASRTQRGRDALASEFHYASQLPEMMPARLKMLLNASQNPESTGALAELLTHSGEDGRLAESLVSFLHEASRNPDTKGDLYKFLQNVSTDREMSAGFITTLSGLSRTDGGQQKLLELLNGVRNDVNVGNAFMSIIQKGISHPGGAQAFEGFAERLKASGELREEFMRSIAHLSSVGQQKEQFRETMKQVFSNATSRDALLDVCNNAILSSKGKLYFDHFAESMGRNSEMRELFMQNIHQATSTARGQSRYLDLMKALNMEPTIIQESERQVRQAIALGSTGPALVRVDRPPVMIAPGAAVHEADEIAGAKQQQIASKAAAEKVDYRAATEKLMSSGLMLNVRRSIFGKSSASVEDVDEISFDPEKLSVKDSDEVYKESNIRLTRDCPDCGGKAFQRVDFCPDCLDEGKKSPMKAKVVYRKKGLSFMEDQDWVEFSSLALKALGNEKPRVTQLLERPLPEVKYREALALAKMYP